MTGNAAKFSQFLASKVPEFDELVLKDIRLPDSWIGHVSSGPFIPDWFTVREIVRQLVEGAAFRATDQEGSAENTLDRFRSMWPNENE